MKSILTLSKEVNNLSESHKNLFYRFYTLSEDFGYLNVPDKMRKWVVSAFKSVKNVEKQKIVRIDNNITSESALYNEIRTKRPIDMHHDTNINDKIEENRNGAFCNPLESTPEDTFGRIKGKKSISASNVAKFESLHGIVVFKEHNPLKFTASDIKDYFHTANKWIDKAHKAHPERKFPFIMWNCLWKSGASIIHGHMQMVLGKDKHYGYIERMKRFADVYEDLFKKDYFEDWFKVHKSLGLGFEKGGYKVFSNLTPRKEKEIIIIAKNFEKSYKVVYKVLSAFLKMGVESFNLGVYLQPLDKEWTMPTIIRIVDRGSLIQNTVDIGAMELLAGTSIITSDPFKVIEKVKKEF